MARKLNPALETLEGRVGAIAALIDELKGENIVTMDLRSLSDFADAFVIATSRSQTHMQSLVGNLVDRLREQGLRPLLKPDRQGIRWMLIDYANVIVHLFDGESRKYYDLERLWGDARTIDWERSAPAEVKDKV